MDRNVAREDPIRRDGVDGGGTQTQRIRGVPTLWVRRDPVRSSGGDSDW